MQNRSRATIEKIQAAGEALVARRGIASLTMDAVAAEAGLSKGGVLHHFRSKEALISSLAARKLRRVVDGIAGEAACFGDGTAPMLRGAVEHASKTYGRGEDFSRALLVAAVENSASLDAFRASFAGTIDQVRRETADPDFGTALLFAVIGLQISFTLGFAQLAPERARAVFGALRQAALAAGTTPAAPTAPAPPG